MSAYFLDIVLQTSDFDFNMRYGVEDALMDALEKAELGGVTGAGTAVDSFCDIDIEVTDFDAGLALIRKVLIELDVPQSTVINFYPEGQDSVVEYRLQEEQTH